MLLVQSFILMIYLCYALHSTLFGQLQTLVVVSPLEKKIYFNSFKCKVQKGLVNF